MNRTKAILAAGTFTGLVLITLLALGFGNLQAGAEGKTAVAPTAVTLKLPQTGDMSHEEALQAWQAYSAQLEQAVQTMQERDSAYKQQLDAANQTILQLQNQINNAHSVPAYEEHEEQEQVYERDND